MIQLQDRDKRIIRLCYEQQFILTEHAEKFFAGASYRACRRRVQELADARYIREEPSASLGRKTVYRVTRLGTAVALESGATAIPQAGALQLATLVHDAVVTSVRLRLEEFWNARFVCERAIKGKEYREVPDGIFFFPSGRGIAIEVENSDKGRTRFLRLLQRWKDTPQIAFVLYVATSRELFEGIKRFLEHAPKDRPMGVVHWQELQAGTPRVWTQRGDIPLFDQREY